MTETSRRKLLAAAGAGTAAAGAVVLTPGAARAATRANPAAAREGVVAYVKDHRGSAVRLMVGEREVVVHDRDLVVRLLNAAGGN